MSSDSPSTMPSPVQGAAWRGAGKVDAQALHPSGCDHARLCHHPVQARWHQHSSSWLCQGHHGNSVIDLPLFNPRGHIEVGCKICWNLYSFQVMARVRKQINVQAVVNTGRGRNLYSPTPRAPDYIQIPRLFHSLFLSHFLVINSLFGWRQQ